MLAVAAGVSVARAEEEGIVFPGRTWERVSPVSSAMATDRLAALSGYLGGRGCVVRGGRMVYTWGDHTKRGDVASACKPWFGHFLFNAIERGKIARIDEKVLRWEPRLGRINAALRHKDRAITWRHLATQTSCYQLVENPGTAFSYNDWQMALLWDTLFLKVYGATYGSVDKRVLAPMLTDRLGCQDNPTFMAFGVRNRQGRLAVSPRDFCRFGLMYLRQGNWRGRQLISAKRAAFVVSSPLPNTLSRAGSKLAEMIPGQRSLGSRAKPDNQCAHEGAYSFLWWVNGRNVAGKRLWPGVPADAYGAFGDSGQRAMAVIPSLDLVISWNDARVEGWDVEGWDKVGRALKMLCDSVTDSAVVRPSKPVAGQVFPDPDNPRWLVRYDPAGDHKPLFLCGPGDPEDFLYRGKMLPDGTRDGDQAELIAKLTGTGANCVYVQAIRSHGGDGDRTHNPFVGHDPRRGLNPKLLAQWRQWLDALDSAGVVTVFFIYDDSARIWDTGDKVGVAERAFLSALVKRFKHMRNLIWCVAEEYQERLSAKRVSEIASVIRRADEFGHPIAVHKLSGLSFAEFADDPNIDQFAIQYNADSPERLHAGVVKAWEGARGRYNLNMSEVAEHGRGASARRKSWACAMGGAYVMVLGMDIATTPPADLADCGRMVRFFESTDFRRMSPADELAAGGSEYVLAKPGELYILYSSKRVGAMGLKGRLDGMFTLKWLDCATGKTVTQTDVRVKATAPDPTFPAPAGIGEEAVVYVRRQRR